MKLINPTYTFQDDPDAQFVIKHDQEIPTEFLSDLADARHASAHRRMGDMERVASIPVAVAEKWKREGFDVFSATAREIIARLQREDLGAFITTTKTI